MTNVRSYTDKELLERARNIENFSGFPEDYWLLGVRSSEDENNKFDDKIYLFKGEEFGGIVTSATTNAGDPALKGFEKYSDKGTFVLKSDFWHYNMWRYGLHKGKMPALRQASSVVGYRDGNKNNKNEEIGNPVKGWFGINFHASSYNLSSKHIREDIGWWSAGCQVVNDLQKYNKILNKVKNQDRVSYLLLKEF